MSEIRVRHSVVGVKDLKEGMIILSFLAFSQDYQSLKETQCKWLKHNFRGTEVVVRRKGQTLEIPMEQLQLGDQLDKLFRFPPALKKLTHVTPMLIGELGKRGFLQFRVEEKVKGQSQKQLDRKKVVEEVNDLVSKITESTVEHDKATCSIEEMLSGSTEQKPNTKDVENQVDQILADHAQEAITTMISLKQSDQTYAHCVEVGVLFQLVYLQILQKTGWKNSFQGEKDIMLASFLHDIGKSRIPKDILDSTVRFERDSKEMKLMKDHPMMGGQILQEMGMPDIYVNMASYHHVKLDPSMKSSYPETKYGQVKMESRLLALVDIYQALVGKRSYKKSWTPPETINYLKVLSGVEYPEDLFGLFQMVMGKYPKSSLVELSDGSIGFVVSVPEYDMDRPKMVLVRNAQKQPLEHNSLLDLGEERDLKIVKIHDSHEFFEGKALEAYQSMVVS